MLSRSMLTDSNTPSNPLSKPLQQPSSNNSSSSNNELATDPTSSTLSASDKSTASRQHRRAAASSHALLQVACMRRQLLSEIKRHFIVYALCILVRESICRPLKKSGLAATVGPSALPSHGTPLLRAFRSSGAHAMQRNRQSTLAFP